MTKAILEAEVREKIDLKIKPLEKRALSLTVKNQDERAMLVADAKDAKSLMEQYEETLHLDANTAQARELYEATRDTRDAVYNPIKAFVKAATEAVKKFDTNETLRIQREQQEAKEKEDQKEREEKARITAETNAALEAEEKKQLEEFERLENEKKKKQELQASANASGNAKIAGIAAKEVARLDNEITQVQEQGEKKIEEIKAKAEEEPPAKLNITKPAIALKKLTWKAKVTNMMKLCRQIGEGNVPFAVVEVRQSQLNDFAKNHDGKTKIEGIEFYQESTGRI